MPPPVLGALAQRVMRVYVMAAVANTVQSHVEACNRSSDPLEDAVSV